MKLHELIGKRIIDILATTQPYDEFKDYGLWKADCYIVLQNGLVLGIPFNSENEEVWIRELDNSAVSYYQRTWRQKKVDASDDLRGKQITDIIIYQDDTDRALLELNNGKIITEVNVAPVGIAVGLYVYSSIKDVEKKFGQDYRRLSRRKESA